MQTFKTGVVIALLLAVCYGAFVALNAPDPELPESIQDWVQDPDLDALAQIEPPTELVIPDVESGTLVSADSLNNPAIDFPPVPSQTSAPPAQIPSLESSSVPALPDLQQSLNTMAEQTQTSGQDLPPPEAAAETTPAMQLPSFTNDTPQTDLVAGDSSPSSLQSFPALDQNALDNLKNQGQDVGAAVESATQDLKNTFGAANSDMAQALAESLPADLASAGSLIPDNLEALKGEVKESIDSANATLGAIPDIAAAEAKKAINRALPTQSFAEQRKAALSKAAAGELRTALAMLSPYFHSLDLSSDERGDLIDILDALSREVIYSRRHLAQAAYAVSSSDTMQSVAAKHGLNPELLAAINGYAEDDRALVPDSELKVVPGPFNAEVSLSREEITLFIDDLYAGRFPITVGKEPPPTQGTFEVQGRRLDRPYYSGQTTLPADDPRNPYGGFWINLGNGLSIHGTPEMASSDLEDAGCISLAPRDARDLYRILTKGSKVDIVP